MKPIRFLVMSVGPYNQNWTVGYLMSLGCQKDITVCLPKQFKENAAGYKKNGVDVYIYDEQKYINADFEYFGFKPRNCGGVGRQGIAEAVEKYGDDFLIFQLDDDYVGFVATNFEHRQKKIRRKENLYKMIYLFDELQKTLGVNIAARTGATILSKEERKLFANKKIFNNFIMEKGNPLNFEGFAALCSDDQRFNIYKNLLQLCPMLSVYWFSVHFHQNQGDRTDGNAVLYNGDCSWKKSFALKMMMPQAIKQYIRKEENRALFREHIEASKLFPPIFLEENGKLVARV